MSDRANKFPKQDQSLRALQLKILYIMKYVDSLCRKNGITYFIMGGTALGAVRHGGFIPWDDDLDIFMTLDQYDHFKRVFEENESEEFIIQEWRTVPEYLEYAKLRMNGTTYIETNFKDRKDMHHGIYIDIMILHKVPNNPVTQRLVYLKSKFVTLYGLSQRNWRPKTKFQTLMLGILKFLPNQSLARWCYRNIYKYDSRRTGYSYCYWITPVKFGKGLFDKELFLPPVEINFEDTKLLSPNNIKEYLFLRYGDYLKIPDDASQKAAVHAELFDCNKSYLVYI